LEYSPAVQRRLVYAIAAAAAALVAGCGGATSSSSAPTASPTPSSNGVADLPPTEILAKAKAALKGADSVHLKGAGGTGSERVEFDIKYTRSNGSAGTVAIAGQQLEIIQTAGTAYVKADAAFWQSQTGSSEIAKLLGGKYLSGPANDPKLKDLAAFGDLQSFADQLLKPEGKITKGEQKTIRGIATIGLVDNSSNGGTLYIATVGEPYPIQVSSTKDGTLDFLEYGEPVEITAPPAEQTIDVSKLGK